jgi:hypothetical protein
MSARTRYGRHPPIVSHPGGLHQKPWLIALDFRPGNIAPQKPDSPVPLNAPKEPAERTLRHGV